MRWGAFLGTTTVVALIILYEWPRIKQSSKKDKAAFLMLLFIGGGLSAFNLAHMTGPGTWIEAFFEPLGRFMEK